MSAIPPPPSYTPPPSRSRAPRPTPAPLQIDIPASVHDAMFSQQAPSYLEITHHLPLHPHDQEEDQETDAVRYGAPSPPPYTFGQRVQPQLPKYTDNQSPTSAHSDDELLHPDVEAQYISTEKRRKQLAGFLAVVGGIAAFLLALGVVLPLVVVLHLSGRM
ncbi:hypothetical protein EXIGLDRAFT_705726 [Exidia glandulosa HHB12029]|uniref:Uncharacterized protein n=1 Tax=Exidia glandulosa HHB12029 TaxID=1314781 RepID=A0A165KH65_EXIGL|nr:hypothetical protein EXIGLDRAFT_705726 [Exidia glandulosa HHB12029]